MRIINQLKHKKMKTIAEQLNVKKFPFKIKDKNNNQLYYENSNGYWIKREFDKNNNKLYFEYSDGFWCKREFDENGNELYYEISSGYWCKREYECNKEIYYENSDGIITDNRPKKCTNKVVTIEGVDYELKEVKK